MTCFSAKGMHPKFDTLGFLADYPNIGPATYNPEKLKKHLPNVNFKRKAEVEEFSKHLGYKVPEILKERCESRRALGPGWHEVDKVTYMYKQCPNNKGKDWGFSTAIRFPGDASITPGPGTYIKKHGDLVVHQTTPRMSFEWDITKRGWKDSAPWCLSPNRYVSLMDYKSIADYVKRRVSLRGPYDLFTGPRDETTIKNHLAPPMFKGATLWPYDLPTETDKLLNNKWIGKWSDNIRSIVIPDKVKSTVSPVSYDPIMPWVYKPRNRKQCGFDICKFPSRPQVQYKVYPGPGRYSIKIRRNENGCSSAFLSTVQRSEYLVPKSMRAF